MQQIHPNTYPISATVHLLHIPLPRNSFYPTHTTIYLLPTITITITATTCRPGWWFGWWSGSWSLGGGLVLFSCFLCWCCLCVWFRFVFSLCFCPCFWLFVLGLINYKALTFSGCFGCVLLLCVFWLWGCAALAFADTKKTG